MSRSGIASHIDVQKIVQSVFIEYYKKDVRMEMNACCYKLDQGKRITNILTDIGSLSSVLFGSISNKSEK